MLPHSIFQTEVQFNAPTSSSHLAGGPYQTSHPTGDPAVNNTDIIRSGSNPSNPFRVSAAYVWDGCDTCNPKVPKSWRARNAYIQHFSTLQDAKDFIENKGRHWIDKASGKVATTSGRSSGSTKSKSKKTSWRSGLKALRRKWKRRTWQWGF
ncbi:hypothetical protein CMK18_22850 [Candidatus Poribacteria bacterium]|nr:hypothetical protein [Candidatus Poribacteria bacterium]